MSRVSRRGLSMIAIGLACLGAWLAPTAQAAAPAWQVSLIPMPTNFIPGTTGTTSETPLYRVIATNIGGAAAVGPVALQVTLPAGLTPLQATGNDGDPSVANPACVPPAGQVVTCTTPDPVYPGRWMGAIVPLEVTAAAGAVLTATAAVSGGGAAASTSYEAEVNPEPPSFGFLQGSTGLATLFGNADGTASSRAGSRSDQLTVNLAFPTEQQPNNPATSSGHLRTLIADLPRGLVANPRATTVRCTEAELINGTGAGEGCPDASQVGMVTIMSEIAGPLVAASPLYNMVPPPGTPALLGFEALNVGIYVHIAGGVRSESDYGIRGETDDILARSVNPLLSAQVQLWGNPSAASHDEIRGACRSNGGSCPIAAAEKSDRAFLRMPSECAGSLGTVVTAKSWEEPSVPHTREAIGTDTAGNPVGVNSCSALEFEPTLTLQPDTAAAESPAGVQVELQVPQNEGLDETATSTVKDVTVTIPAGMAVNPAAATGLAACLPAQIALHSAARPSCPNNSKIGSVEVQTPLLDHALPGAVYVAQPYDNPFGTLLGVYVVVDSPRDGIVVKLAGRTEADPDTGQLTTSFTEAPELPFSSFAVDLFAGPRAALRTPSTCGTYTTASEITPWSGNAAIPDENSFQVTRGSNGAPCAASEAEMPNRPSFEAGTEAPLAAAYSPFSGRLAREDGEQQLKALSATLPAGLTARLAGVESCSEAAISAAASRTGREELASPSCPASSGIGSVAVGAGAGPAPYYTSGGIYLAGPYKGAPVSGVAITPAVAGPFDLGTVVVRAPLRIDPTSTRATFESDEFPGILQGIPLELRDARLTLDRPEFTLNPTSCNKKAITGQALSLLGNSAPLSARFQVGGCRGLAFAPRLFLRLKGGTSRGAHPELRAVFMPGEGANTSRISVALPRSEFLENAHIRTVCTRVQFAAHQCPKGSVYGHAKVITPLLDEPLVGPVYLRSSSHELPDMVLAVHGPSWRPIEVELVGRIDSANGGIRSTFETVPDQPVTKAILNMKGGAKGLLVNSRDTCAHTYRATAKLNGQNGKTHDFKTKLKVSCGKKNKRKGHR